MKIILMYVSSVDGKITKGDNPDVTVWSSKEDQELFEKVRDKSTLVVMGRATFEAAKIKLQPDILRIVMTRTPQKYKNVPGMLEFTDETPTQLVSRLKNQYQQMLLVGGSEIASLFFKEKLIDEVWLTIEPAIFGKGKPMVAEESLNISLKLLDLRRLNPRGTLHLHYEVVKS